MRAPVKYHRECQAWAAAQAATSSLLGDTLLNSRLIAVSITFCSSLLVLQAQSPAKLNINLKQLKSSISPTLYGLMTEEINYSYDGGLYAELVRNRTFRSDWTGILNWYLIEKGSPAAKLASDLKEGPSAALKANAKLEVTRADANSLAGL